MTNPLLHFSGLPHFDQIKPEHVSPAITQLLEESRALVTHLEGDTATPTWDNFEIGRASCRERV